MKEVKQYKTSEIQRAKNRERMRRRRANMTPEEIRAKNRKYYEKRTPERRQELNELARERYHNMTPAEKFEVSEKRRKYYQANREKILAYQNEYNHRKREQKLAAI